MKQFTAENFGSTPFQEISKLSGRILTSISLKSLDWAYGTIFITANSEINTPYANELKFLLFMMIRMLS